MLDKNTLENIIEYLESQIERENFIELEDSERVVIVARYNENVPNIIDKNIDKILDEKVIKKIDNVVDLLGLNLENIFEYVYDRLDVYYKDVFNYEITFLHKYTIVFTTYKFYVFVYLKD